MQRSLFLLAATLAASATASAQSRPSTLDLRDAYRPDLAARLESWRLEHGYSWHTDVDEGTGYLEMLYGGGAILGERPRDDAEWFALARQALAATEPMHGLEGSTLIEDRAQFLPLGQVGTTDKMTLRFRQVVGGVAVEGGYANVLFDYQGRLLSIQAAGLPMLSGFDVRPRLTQSTALEHALATFDRMAHEQPTSVGVGDLVIVQVDQAEQRVPVLAWRFDVLAETPGFDPVGYTLWIDARNGSLAKSENLIHHFDVGGTVYTKASPGTLPDTAANPETQQVMKYARVQSSAGTVYTDANGNFNYPGQAGPLTCTFTYVGNYNNVFNDAGAEYSLASSLSGTGNSVVLNPTDVETVTSQANVFISVNKDRDWVRTVNPADAKADFVHTANVNLASTCNAYFNGSSINFYAAGGGCPNTGYSTVVSHEDGHWLNVLYGTGNGSDGMGEGNADVWAMYVWDTRFVGQNFCGTGCHVRDGLNTTPFCGDCCPACYGEVHADGEPWMGAAWKIRRNLNTTLGNTAGDAVADNLFLAWMNGYNQTQIKSIIEVQWLTLDDNDANIDNGTPNYNDIDGGFTEQGFPGYQLDFISITNVTDLPDTTNQAGPYVVQATVVALMAPPLTVVNLRYSLDGSSFTTIPMTNIGGDVYEAGIPGQTAPQWVNYFVRAVDSNSNAETYPAGAPTNSLLFAVGDVTCFTDNFETSQAWTVANTSLTTGAWERGNPNGTAAQPEDDNPSGTGTQCYFTDQGSVGGSVGEADVDGGPTRLSSPTLDFSDGNGRISYYYWMYNDDGDDSLTVEISNNNGASWLLVRTFTGGAGGWNFDEFLTDPLLAPTATFRVRFSVSDNPNDSITEAAIDDFQACTVGAVPCPVPVDICQPSAPDVTDGCTPDVSWVGTPDVTECNTPGPSDFVVTFGAMAENKTAIVVIGKGAAISNPWSPESTRCFPSPYSRTGLQDTGDVNGAAGCGGEISLDVEAYLQGGNPLLTPVAIGDTFVAQTWYRDPNSSTTTQMSDAVSFTACP
jgi:hypothetical protein